MEFKGDVKTNNRYEALLYVSWRGVCELEGVILLP